MSRATIIPRVKSVPVPPEESVEVDGQYIWLRHGNDTVPFYREEFPSVLAAISERLEDAELEELYMTILDEAGGRELEGMVPGSFSDMVRKTQDAATNVLLSGGRYCFNIGLDDTVFEVPAEECGEPERALYWVAVIARQPWATTGLIKQFTDHLKALVPANKKGLTHP